jgi:conjugal transfer pilus assembly protein TraD
VICIDPKGDQPFETSIKAACRHANRETDYTRVHLAFPGDSIRIDPLKNYTNPSDLASRIAALMPGGDKSSSFRDFAWNVLNAIVLGMIDIGEKPTLVKIRSYVDNGVADLLARVTLRYYDEVLPQNWEMDVSNYARTVKQGKGKSAEDGELLVRQSLNLLLGYYLDVLVPRGFHNEAVESLSTIYKHDSAHYSKMIANLIPILGMLTTGELGPLLSPDPRDVSDPRPMSDLQALIRSNAVVYIGLDSLANKSISTAVGSMLLSDLTSVAASIYNYASQDGVAKKVFLIVDEASEVVNEPYIQILNKSSGANFINIAAAQTVPDFAARFESMDKARQMLGNFNNLYAMRIKDRVTQDFVIETFGQTYVYSKQVIMGTTSSTEKNITHFTGSMQERVTETLDDMFPPDLLGQLPNWQYIGSVSGGRIIKGRLDIIQHED